MGNESGVNINGVVGAIGRAMMGHGAFPATSFTKRWKKLSLLESSIELTRPFLLIMAVPMVGIGAFLSMGQLPSPLVLGIGVLAVILSVASTHVFNDWVDRERDKAVWPNRPIPAKRFPVALAPIFALFLAVLATGITWIFYNPKASMVLGATEVLAILYCVYLRDRVGYLSLPFIIALFPVGGWAAISPETLFTSNLPWLLGGIVFTWQAGHIMVYSPAHPIRDEGGVLRCEKKAAFFFPTPRQAALLGLFFVSLLFVESLLLLVVMRLGIFYWSLALPVGALTVGTAVWLAFNPVDQQRSIFAFNAASMFMTFLCGGVILDVIFAKHLGIFFAWAISTIKDLVAIVERGSGAIESSIYAIGLAVAIAISLFSVVGLLKGIMKARKSHEAL